MNLKDTLKYAVKRDKSYLISFLLTIFGLIFLFSHHDWQSRPSLVPSNGLFTRLPDFSAFKNVKEKKARFFEFLRPLVEKENRKLLYKKANLVKILTRMESESYHSNMNSRKLHKLAKEFGLKAETIKSNIQALKNRIDIIPTSLVLAQAANESAWGTSRFATQANNLFGQWCFELGCGLVPKRRNQGSFHEVRKYPSVQSSISSYMRNLNSHSSYSDLRNIRTELRRRGQPITGVKLAWGLTNYSERGDDYVKDVINLIKNNHLE